MAPEADNVAVEPAHMTVPVTAGDDGAIHVVVVIFTIPVVDVK